MFPTLTDEQRAFVHTVRELAQSEFRQRAPRYMDGQLRLDWLPASGHSVTLLGLYSDDEVALDLGVENAQGPLLTGRLSK